MDPIRVCVFTESTLFKLVKSKGNPNNETMFTGIAGPVMNDLLALMTRRVKNVELVQKFSTYDCLQSMTKNESDLLLSLVPYGDENLDFDLIFPFNLLHEDKLSIFSAYNTTSNDKLRFADMPMSALKGVGLEVIVMIFALVLLFYILLNFSTWIRGAIKFGRSRCIRCHRPRHYRLKYGFETIYHFLTCGCLEFDDNSRKLICLLLVLTSYFAFLSFGSVLTTELSSIENPKIISTYDDVTSRPELKVHIAPLWRKFLEFHGPNSKNSKFLKSIRLIEDGDGIEYTMKQIKGVFTGKVVAVFTNFWGDMIRMAGCMLGDANSPIGEMMEGWKDIAYPHISNDPNAESIYESMIMTQNFRRSASGQAIIKNWQRQFEGLIVRHTLGEIKYVIPENEFLKKGLYYRECMSAPIIKPPVPDVQSIKLVNLGSLWKMLGFAAIILVHVLIVECLRKKFGNNRRKSKRRRGYK